MQVSRIVLLLVQCLIKILLESMKLEEKNLDADGCPLNDGEYDKQSFLLTNFRQILKDFEDEK